VKNSDVREVRISDVGERSRNANVRIPGVGVLAYGVINCSRWLVRILAFLVHSGLGLEKLVHNFKLFL